MTNYCVWFIDNPNKAKMFTNKTKALKFFVNSRGERFINKNVGAYQEDTIKGVK